MLALWASGCEDATRTQVVVLLSTEAGMSLQRVDVRVQWHDGDNDLHETRRVEVDTLPGHVVIGPRGAALSVAAGGGERPDWLN